MCSNKISPPISYFIVIILALLITSGDGRTFRERDFETKDGDGLTESDLGDMVTTKVFVAGVFLFVLYLVISCLCRCARVMKEEPEDITRIVIERQYQYPYSLQQRTETTGPQQVIYNQGFPFGQSNSTYVYNTKPSQLIDDPPPSYYDATSTSKQSNPQEEPPIQSSGIKGNSNSS